jgi:hypothetical protein
VNKSYLSALGGTQVVVSGANMFRSDALGCAFCEAGTSGNRVAVPARWLGADRATCAAPQWPYASGGGRATLVVLNNALLLNATELAIAARRAIGRRVAFVQPFGIASASPSAGTVG